jgi:polysaccharide export outer membrane protein
MKSSNDRRSCYETVTFHQPAHLQLDTGNPRRLDVRVLAEMNTSANQISNESDTVERSGHYRRVLRLACLFAIFAPFMVFTLLMAGCGTDADFTDPYSHSPQPPVFTHFDIFPAYTNVLHEADMVDISFRYSTNFNTVQRIGSDGMLNLVGVGEVKAADKTILQLQHELTVLYQSQVKDDPLTVKMVSGSASVYVMGAVNRPGKIPMDRPMTVIDAIVEAGGFDQYHAKLSKVSVLRIDGDSQRIYWVNLNDVFEGRDPNPFYLKPFDVVRVPAKTFNF